MYIHNVTKKTDEINFILSERELYFISCHASEIDGISGKFLFDAKTINECMLGKSNSYLISLPGYDFLSVIQFDLQADSIKQSEVNLYVSKN